MLFYKQRRKAVRYYRYLTVLFQTSGYSAKEKKIFFDISKIAINRYLYSFFKMFQLEGYTVYIPKSTETANILCNDKGEFRYASWLLSEKVIKFGNPLGSEIIKFKKDQLSNEYFNAQISGYHVPMSCYPWFYKDYSRFKDLIVKEDRKSSVFMSGNIDDEFYDQISESKYFDTIPSRKKTAECLKHNPFYYRLKNKEELNKFLNGQIDNKIVIIDSSKDFRIDIDKLPDVLNKFSFYLALPGILIPQSHNLIEAMLCGCIPVIHKDYANLLTPPLESFHNAIVFGSLTELENLIKKLFQMEEIEIQRLRKNVLAYYNVYLTPEAVVKQVIKNSSKKIFIQAEHLSI